MKTDYPTTDLYFVFAFTKCKLRVYKTDEHFAREVLTTEGVREWLGSDDIHEWRELEMEIFISLIRSALPKMISKRMQKTTATFAF